MFSILSCTVPFFASLLRSSAVQDIFVDNHEGFVEDGLKKAAGFLLRDVLQAREGLAVAADLLQGDHTVGR